MVLLTNSGRRRTYNAERLLELGFDTTLLSGIVTSGEATWLAVPGRAATVELPHSAPLDELLDVVLSAGTLTVCTQCAVRRDLTESELLPGVRIAGAATFVEETLAPDVQALVY